MFFYIFTNYFYKLFLVSLLFYLFFFLCLFFFLLFYCFLVFMHCFTNESGQFRAHVFICWSKNIFRRIFYSKLPKVLWVLSLSSYSRDYRFSVFLLKITYFWKKLWNMPDRHVIKSWARAAGLISWLAFNLFPILASHSDWYIWWPRTQYFTVNSSSISIGISSAFSNKSLIEPSLFWSKLSFLVRRDKQLWYSDYRKTFSPVGWLHKLRYKNTHERKLYQIKNLNFFLAYERNRRQWKCHLHFTLAIVFFSCVCVTVLKRGLLVIIWHQDI